MIIARKLWSRLLSAFENVALSPGKHVPDYGNVRYEFIMPELIAMEIKDGRNKRHWAE